MPNQMISIGSKRILAWLLIVCLILSNSSLAGIEVKAEETEESSKIVCTITPKVNVGGKDYTIPDSYISIKDSKNNSVELNNGKCDLVAKAKYTCVIKGAEISEHTVDFTAPSEAGNIIVMGDASKIQLVYNDLDPFYVEDIRTPVNDLGITWTWNTANSSILSVDANGVIIGKGNGITTVTRTSSTASEDDTPLTNKTQVTIVGESKYTLNYKYGNQTLSDDGKIVITIKDSKGNTVKKEDSQYTFVWGETYTYDITEKNGIIGTHGSFIPTKSQIAVDIPVTLTLPVFKLEGKDLSANTTKIKSGEEDISITCDNVGSLYDSQNWKIQINNGEKKIVSSTDIKFDTNKSVIIKYYYGNEQANSYSVASFSSYNVNYYYDGVVIAPETTVFNNNTTVNKFKANNIYTLEEVGETGLEFTAPNPNTYKVETKYTEESYDVYLQSKDVKITEPQIYIVGREPNEAGEYEFTYGDEIEVKLEKRSTYLNEGKEEEGWQWSCQNGNSSLSGISTYDSGQDVLTYKLNLEGETEGVYTLKYTFGNGEISSNEIKVRIKKIKIYADRLPSITKPYDGNNEFEYKLKLNNKCFKDQDGNTMSYNNNITLKCTVSKGDVGEYDNIQIKEVIVDNGSAFDTSGLIDKKNWYSVDKASITKAQDVKLNINMLRLYYMDQTGDPVNSKFSEVDSSIYGDSIPTSLKRVIFDYLGKPVNIDEEKKTCSFDTDKLTFENKNMKCTITGGTTFRYSSQVLDFKREMQNKIDIKQEQFGNPVIVNATNKWINANALQVEFNSFGEAEFGEYYDRLTFKKLECVDGIIETYDNISGDEQFPINLQQKKEDEDTYYGIVLSKGGQYKTIALIIRIVAEQNKDNIYMTTIEGDNDVTYSVVNLYLDASKDEVVFEDPLGGVSTESLDYSSLKEKTDYKENGESITFEIQNMVSGIHSVRYGFAEFNGKEPDCSRINWKNGGLETKQSVELDLEDGNYVMYVEVTDEVGNQSTYVTNGFVVDNKPPQLQFLLNDKEIPEDELAERIYKNEKQEISIYVIEDNIATVEAKVSATNRKGESVLTEEELQQMEDKIENDIKESNTYTLNTVEDASYDAKEISELEDGLIPIVVEESISTQTIQLKATDMAGNVLGKDVDGEYDAEFEDFELLVTNNPLVQILHSYWILMILAFVVAGGIIAVVIVKHKEKKVSE